MKCEKISLYLADYLRGELGLLTRLAVTVHLKYCQPCRSFAAELQETLTVLEADVLPEPSPYLWRRIRNKILRMAESIPTTPRPVRRYSLALIAVLLMMIAVALTVVPSASSTRENGSSLFWAFFNSDLWDFSTFFRRVNAEKLARLKPKIERRLKRKLAQELELNGRDESRLFPLLQSFSYKMKEYCTNYTMALSELARAVENNRSTDLKPLLQKIHLIRKNWGDSRWRLLRDVRFILNERQFARFLIFTERLPYELHTICMEVYDAKG